MAGNDDVSDDTLEYVKVADQKMGNKYGVSLYDVLTDPDSLKGKQNAKQIVDGLKGDVAAFFDSLTSKLNEEQQELSAQLSSTDIASKKMGEAIRNKASYASIPFIKPVDVERDTEKDEVIIVEKYDGNVDSLVTRLAGISHYVADLSTQYKEYSLGSWLFSGGKNYLLSVNSPTSILFNIEVSKNEINFKLDSIGEGL